VPFPLPPTDPPLDLSGATLDRLRLAEQALARLELAGAMVPSLDWFVYAFVRKEAVISSQIEGTQASLIDLLSFEATQGEPDPSTLNADVEEVCNYVDALHFARARLADPQGPPLSMRVLNATHARLLRGARGASKLPGEIRRSQNWIGGSRPGNAMFVPPPPHRLGEVLSSLWRFIHSKDQAEDQGLHPLVRAGLIHVQFETIHPYLDGNGRIGRMFITLLVEHWGLLDQPLLYPSVAFKRRQQEYYARLAAVRTDGDWERWTAFFLDCVKEAADDGARIAQAIHALMGRDRARVVHHERATITVVKLLDLLPSNPVLTVPRASELLGTTAPPARKAIDLLEEIGVLHETTGKQRDRAYAYHDYLELLTES